MKNKILKSSPKGDGGLTVGDYQKKSRTRQKQWKCHYQQVESIGNWGTHGFEFSYPHPNPRSSMNPIIPNKTNTATTLKKTTIKPHNHPPKKKLQLQVVKNKTTTTLENEKTTPSEKKKQTNHAPSKP